MTVPYDPRIESIMKAAEQNKRRFEVEGKELDLSDIPFSEAECYGWDHAQQTMLLSFHLAQTLGVTKTYELDAVKLAGLMHDLGRRSPWRATEPDVHNVRSADLATAYLQKKFAPTSLIERVQRLIANHDLSATELPRDPLAMALWDADSLEAARLSPGTGEGLAIFRKRTARLCTEFARDKGAQRKWLKSRGWKS